MGLKSCSLNRALNARTEDQLDNPFKVYVAGFIHWLFFCFPSKELGGLGENHPVQ